MVKNIVIVLLFCGCSTVFGDLFSPKEELTLVFPSIPDEKSEIFSPEFWQLSFFDENGKRQVKTFSPDTEKATISVKKNSFNPILLEGKDGDNSSLFHPAGGIYPHDFTMGENLSWEGGFTAHCGNLLLSQTRDEFSSASAYLATFNWVKLRKEVAKYDNPWLEIDENKIGASIALRKTHPASYRLNSTEREERFDFADISSLTEDEPIYSPYIPQGKMENPVPYVKKGGAFNVYRGKNYVILINFKENFVYFLDIIKKTW